MLVDLLIRDWVLVPIVVVMILVGLARHHLTSLFNKPPVALVSKLAESSAMVRARTLEQTNILPLSAFDHRRLFLMAAFKDLKYLSNKNINAQNPMSDPQSMQSSIDMMKNNMLMFIPQSLLMAWISYFFSGFIICKLPFPLTLRFKSMLQSGIETADMDVRWISSMSWYFLNLFGLSSIYTLILGDASAADSVKDMQYMQAMGAPQPMQQPAEIHKAFQRQAETFQIMEYSWALLGIEDRLIASFSN
jgi:hypothetical protein